MQRKPGMTVISIHDKVTIEGNQTGLDSPHESHTGPIFVDSVKGEYTNYYGAQPAADYTRLVADQQIFYVRKSRALELILAIAKVNGWDIDVSGLGGNAEPEE